MLDPLLLNPSKTFLIGKKMQLVIFKIISNLDFTSNEIS